jgi:hypothetical protein
MEEAYFILQEFRSSTLQFSQWKSTFNTILESINRTVALNYEGAQLSIDPIL